jgi:hypothetical protein
MALTRCSCLFLQAEKIELAEKNAEASTTLTMRLNGTQAWKIPLAFLIHSRVA